VAQAKQVGALLVKIADLELALKLAKMINA
jgi:hypothetical protein